MDNQSNIQVIDFTDESVSLLKLDWISTSILVFVLIICGLINTGSKSFVINFVIKYAPKGRPINTLTLIDQVSKKIHSTINYDD